MMSYTESHVLLYMLEQNPPKIVSVSGIYFGVDYDYFDRVVSWTARLPPDSCMGLIRPSCDMNL